MPVTQRKRWVPQPIAFTKHDGLPKYIMIARAIERAIIVRELLAGDVLPSQKDLAKSFNVTVMTMRQAVGVLTEKQILSTEQGRGTFVTESPYQLSMGPLASLADQTAAAGIALRTAVVHLTEVALSPMEQQRMQFSKPAAYELVRLRFIDERPLILQSSLLPLDVGATLNPNELTDRSLYDVLRLEFGIQVEHAVETIEAVQLDQGEAELLGKAPGAVALLSVRLTYDANGTAVVFDRALAPGDSTVVQFERRQGEIGPQLTFSDDDLPPSRLL